MKDFNSGYAAGASFSKLCAFFLILLFSVANAWGYDIVHSPGPDRTGATVLDGSEVSGNIYAFIDTDSGIKKVKFYVNGAVYKNENLAPWDLAGTDSNDDSLPFDTTQLADGQHLITADVTLDDSSVQTLNATIQVDNLSPVLEASPKSFSETLLTDSMVTRALDLDVSDGSSVSVSLSVDQSWVTLSATSGTSPFTTNVTLDSTGLAAGSYSATITASSDGLDNIQVPVALEVKQDSETYGLMLSNFSDRSSAQALAGQSVDGDVYVFTAPDSGVAEVNFYLNDPDHSGSPHKREGFAPFDFAGTASDGTALPFDTTVLSAGTHVISAELDLTDGAVAYTSGELVIEGEGTGEAFLFSPSSLDFTVIEPDTTADATLEIRYENDAEEIYTISSSAAWLSVVPDMDITPASHTVSVDTEGLEAGSYQGELIVEGNTTETVPVSLVYETSDSTDFSLMVSDFSTREQSVGLEGQELAGDAYIHVQPEQGVKKVAFYLNSSLSGTPDVVENVAPFDFGGTASTGEAIAFDTTTLSDGDHFITIEIFMDNGDQDIAAANFTVNNNPAPEFTLTPDEIVESASSDDPPVEVPVVLDLVHGTDSTNSSFTVSIGAPWISVSPASGAAPETLTVTLDPSGLTGGTYESSITINGDELANVSLPIHFTVLDGLPALEVNPGQITLSAPPDSGVLTTSFDISTSDDSSTGYNDSSNQDWLTIDGASGVTPETVSLKVDTGGLNPGVHEAQLDLTATDYVPATVTVMVEITDDTKCAPVTCSEIKVDLPYVLEFDQEAGGVEDRFAAGTGFTYVLPSSKIDSYIPDNIELDTVNGVLQLTTTNGIKFLNVNNQANPLGVGFAGPNQVTRISTQINNPHPGTGEFEQAGLWFGYNDDNYVKLVYNSFPDEPGVEYLYEKGGARSASKIVPTGDLSNGRIELELVADPATRLVKASYSINGGLMTEVASFEVDSEFFSFDAAGIDPEIGTRSFSGIMTTHRHGSSPVTYEFEYFSVQDHDQATAEGSYSVSRSSHSIGFPTSMVWAPDGKLYVTELFGKIHALTYDENLNVISDEVITSLTDTLGSRLTLGITVYDDDPSDDSVYSLWVASSSPSVDNGVANSSTVTRLSGLNFENVEQVITGLPRAIANHAINSLHFGDDNRLYMAIGGNTGAGAVVDEETEFGDRAEQPLSAAIVVADVFTSGFDGTCANDADIYGPPPCDVEPYATGLRNAYDFVFHSNQEMYAPDNGLGVSGAFPPSPTPDCSGVSSSDPVEEGGQNPGPQPDWLYRIQQGRYYGHPNPSRDECVFNDGSLQGVEPLPNYQPPIANLGTNASANGMVEYRSSRACGKLQGDLMVVRFSLGDDIIRATLSEDGLSVESQEVLITGFNDPLPLSEQNGDLFVGEFGAGKVTALRLDPVGCWSTAQPMPIAILDPGSVAVDDQLYSIAGKTSGGPRNDVYRYNVEFDQWVQLASKPGSAVENPAVAADGGYIYVLGGSTGPFSGAVDEVWRYDIAANTWDSVASMPQAVGGVRAEVIGGRIYVAGGMDSGGASVTSLQIYDIASDSWTFGPNMSQERDNPGTVVVDGELYVLSGRHRLSDGTTLSEGVPSMEIFDPQAGTWRDGPAMPRGRRAFATGTIDGKLQIVGGERNAATEDGLFYIVDVYDPETETWSQMDKAPAPRHGPAYATIGNQLIVVGGGDAVGSTFTDTTQIMVVD